MSLTFHLQAVAAERSLSRAAVYKVHYDEKTKLPSSVVVTLVAGRPCLLSRNSLTLTLTLDMYRDGKKVGDEDRVEVEYCTLMPTDRLIETGDPYVNVKCKSDKGQWVTFCIAFTASGHAELRDEVTWQIDQEWLKQETVQEDVEEVPPTPEQVKAVAEEEEEPAMQTTRKRKTAK